MKNIQVVIGAGYGDEGKGLLTDYLAAKAVGSKAVVRFNGGAQAGHGVELKDGKRHVFHHLGSGTLTGASTILSRHFIVNPILCWKEVQELYSGFSKGVTPLPKLIVDPRCIITTPFEMELNQALERSREDGRHGSCGVGIGETVERESRGYNLSVESIIASEFEDVLNEIRYDYFPKRAEELGLEIEDVDQGIIDQFIIDVYDFYECADIMHDYEAVEHFDNVIFEGAQGLCLDEFSKDFPHVTRSRTGSKNVIEILDDCEFDTTVDVCYVTRCYTTRHGAGPLNGEIHKELGIVDKTNAPNEFQGSMRYAELDISRIADEVCEDIEHFYHTGIRINRQLYVTHCDQLHKITTVKPKDIVSELSLQTAISEVYTSWGPTRDDITIGCPKSNG